MQGLGDNRRSILDRSMKLLHFPSSSDYTTGCGTDGALYSTTANPSLTPVTGHWTTLQAWKVPIEIDDGGGGCLDPALNTTHPILLATAATRPLSPNTTIQSFLMAAQPH